MLRLKCAYQTYEWGKIGDQSKVATLLQSSQPDFELKNIPYAELWMGTHPNGPSLIENCEAVFKSLATYVKDNPLSLGAKVIDKFGVQLPFLFKVLSVNKALSIQAHPNKSHAEQLHKEQPDMYKDPNHKPELAIALTTFEALCGFRLPKDIVRFLKALPELRAVVGEQNAVDLETSTNDEESKLALKSCFYALMTCPKEAVEVQLSALVNRHSKEATEDLLSSLFLRIHSSFPGDSGCFGIYFFNYIKLKPGQAMFLGPNEPHAYLYGDCIECMACSDNVVRAGLTPKYKDVTTLCEMLTYECGSPKSRLFEGKKKDKYTMLFAPPVPDFLIYKVELPEEVRVHHLEALDSASIVLFVTGTGEARTDCDPKILEFVPGTVFFLTAGDMVKLRFSTDVLLFRAAANMSYD